ncbi:poly [ADP-ribose] polymerase [Plakobranchus ocellatus]|uniref:Poly [ADP-ribose] polymerase n=1 Tax=Plakobranchus ocellatus TaxID=259542 RepID=A0AAV4AHI5_9GAST|nr:poly [ADP-ribose] polymerase [Plakobranchus ocellatus]
MQLLYATEEAKYSMLEYFVERYPCLHSEEMSTLKVEFGKYQVHPKVSEIASNDVCVCGVHRSRDLKVYPVSKQVLRKGGLTVQNELNKAGSKNSEELEMGQVEMIDAGKLPNFKKVMFINLRSYKDGNEKPPLLSQGLKRPAYPFSAGWTRRSNVKLIWPELGIAVPALGTGGLNYPPEKVASATVDAVARHNLQFKDKSSIETVNIVLLDSDLELITTYLRVCLAGSVKLSHEDEDDEIGASGGPREIVLRKSKVDAHNNTIKVGLQHIVVRVTKAPGN